MTISHETKPADLRERMGAEATDAQAREMLDILIYEGWRGQDTAEIPEKAWLAMLEQALTAAPVLT